MVSYLNYLTSSQILSGVGICKCLYSIKFLMLCFYLQDLSSSPLSFDIYIWVCVILVECFLQTSNAVRHLNYYLPVWKFQTLNLCGSKCLLGDNTKGANLLTFYSSDSDSLLTSSLTLFILKTCESVDFYMTFIPLQSWKSQAS